MSTQADVSARGSSAHAARGLSSRYTAEREFTSQEASFLLFEKMRNYALEWTYPHLHLGGQRAGFETHCSSTEREGTTVRHTP